MGFGPFSDVVVNPSESLVNDLFDLMQNRDDFQCEKLILPVDYKKADQILDKIDFSRFDFVFQFGVATTRHKVSLERVALNWIESSIPDNSGNHINLKKISLTSADAKFSSVDLAKLSFSLNARFNNCTEVSLSAGAFLCNFVYYKARLKTDRCLFVHIPAKLKSADKELNSSEEEYQETIKQVAQEIILGCL